MEDDAGARLLALIRNGAKWDRAEETERDFLFACARLQVPTEAPQLRPGRRPPFS